MPTKEVKTSHHWLTKIGLLGLPSGRLNKMKKNSDDTYFLPANHDDPPSIVLEI